MERKEFEVEEIDDIVRGYVVKFHGVEIDLGKLEGARHGPMTGGRRRRGLRSLTSSTPTPDSTLSDPDGLL